MKMPAAVRAQLLTDIQTVVCAYCPTVDRSALTLSHMWQLAHEVHAQRSYGDDHPRWTNRKRVLPCSHASGKGWLAELYATLDDNHIGTALHSIQRELSRTVQP